MFNYEIEERRRSSRFRIQKKMTTGLITPSVLVRVLQRNITNRLCMYIHTYILISVSVSIYLSLYLYFTAYTFEKESLGEEEWGQCTSTSLLLHHCWSPWPQSLTMSLFVRGGVTNCCSGDGNVRLAHVFCVCLHVVIGQVNAHSKLVVYFSKFYTIFVMLKYLL